MWRFPLIRVLPFFVVGLLSARFLPGGAIGLFLLVVPFGMTARWKSLRHLSIMGGLAIIAGWTNAKLHDERLFQDHYTHRNLTVPHTFSANITQRMRPSSRYNRYVVDVSAMDGHSSRGKALVYLPFDRTSNLLPGDGLMLIGIMRGTRPPAQPGDFDYGGYLANKSIYGCLYPKTWRVLPAVSNSFDRTIARLQQQVEVRFRQGGMGETELQVLMALVWGKQLDIPKETLTDYQYAGAIHILSVSGLHVGLLLGFVLFCLRPLPQSRGWNLFRFTFVLLFLWTFACAAGLSPSVVRSATMFTFVAAGTLLRKDSNLLHTLGVSMLVILAVSPSFLYDAGFQLSYLSLFFIVWLQPFFDRITRLDNPILRYIWNLLTVSFSAQLGVLPLTLYYFHQFPGLFFLTNLIILPVLSIIMASGVLALLGAMAGCLPGWLVWLTDKLLWSMDWVIHQIAGIDVLVLRNITFNEAFLITSYIAVFALAAALRKPSFIRMQIAIIGIFSVQVAFLVSEISMEGRDVFYVMHQPKATELVEWRYPVAEIWTTSAENGQRVWRSALAVDEYRPHRIRNCLYAARHRILVVDSSGIYNGRPDIVVLTGSPRINLERLLNETSAREVVADGSNYKSCVARWSETCRKMKIPFHATAEKGFYCKE